MPQAEAEAFWAKGWPEKALNKLQDYGFIQSRPKGEYHANNQARPRFPGSITMWQVIQRLDIAAAPAVQKSCSCHDRSCVLIIVFALRALALHFRHKIHPCVLFESHQEHNQEDSA